MKKFLCIFLITFISLFTVLNFAACDFNSFFDDVKNTITNAIDDIFGTENDKTPEPAQYKDIEIAESDISVHFLELGNKYTGDCTLVKTGNTEILIDCGSKTSSIETVSSYLKGYVTDGIIEYVIVTHAHEDHYAGFATSVKQNSIFDLFDCRTIITFSQSNQPETAVMYNNFFRELSDEIGNGAKHYTADNCYNGADGAQRVYPLENGYEFEILYNKYYFEKASKGENDHSVCCMVQGNGKHFLFTGDLEEKGEKALADRYKEDHSDINFSDFKVDLYKAGHHGSKTSTTVYFLQVFKPLRCCVCCCAGSPEYTEDNANQFPTQTFVDNIAPFTKEIYVTTLCVDYKNNVFKSFNGNIVLTVKGADVGLKCSDNNVILKDSEWFKQKRTLPDAWK